MFLVGHSRNRGGSFSPSKIQYSVLDEGAAFSGICKLILLLRQTLLLSMPRMIIVWPRVGRVCNGRFLLDTAGLSQPGLRDHQLVLE